MTGRAAPGTGVPRDSGSRTLAVLPYAVMAVVAVADVAAGPSVGLLPLVSVGPALAGLVGDRRRTAFIGVLGLLLCLLLGANSGLLGTRRVVTAMAAVACVTATGLLAVAMRERRERELADVRAVAEVTQRVLLRPVPERAGPLRVAVSYTSATAQARIGGDLYDVVVTGDRVRVIVGDVQGKGLEAVGTAAVVLGAFREAAHDERDLRDVGARLERSADRELHGGKFVTAVLAELRGDGTALVLNYGHPAPLLVGADGTSRFAEPRERALPLGLGVHETAGPAARPVPFGPGDRLLLYTDGVSEARDRHGDFYPLPARARLLRDGAPGTALKALRGDLVKHAGGPLHDDAAMLLVAAEHEVPPPER